MAPNNSRFSRAVIVGNNAGVSTIAPIRGITADSPSGDGCPSTAARPADADTKPSRQRIVVVFPDPLGPRKPNTPPSGTDKSRPCTATWGARRQRRYSLHRPSISITAVMTRQTHDTPLAGDPTGMTNGTTNLGDGTMSENDGHNADTVARHQAS